MSTSFAAVVGALRAALTECGLQESPQAHDSPQGFTRRHRGYRLAVDEVGGTGKFNDRSRAMMVYRLRLLLTHRLRSTGNDGHDDVLAAGSDYEAVTFALMGDQLLNAQGAVAVGRFTARTSGEWLESTATFTLEGEVDWPLDGEGEEGS